MPWRRRGEASHAHLANSDEEAPMVHEGMAWGICRMRRESGGTCLSVDGGGKNAPARTSQSCDV
jgi:hypothetical protein